jgi:hypothetical protein
MAKAIQENPQMKFTIDVAAATVEHTVRKGCLSYSAGTHPPDF